MDSRSDKGQDEPGSHKELDNLQRLFQHTLGLVHLQGDISVKVKGIQSVAGSEAYQARLDEIH